MKKLFEFIEDGEEYTATLTQPYENREPFWVVECSKGVRWRYAANDSDKLNWINVMLAKHDKGNT